MADEVRALATARAITLLEELANLLAKLDEQVNKAKTLRELADSLFNLGFGRLTDLAEPAEEYIRALGFGPDADIFHMSWALLVDKLSALFFATYSSDDKWHAERARACGAGATKQLDSKTMIVEAYRDHIEGKFIRAIAATAQMIDLIKPESSQNVIHSVDFRSMTWFGELLTFTENQAPVVALLYEHWKQGTPDVGDQTLLNTVDPEAPPARLNVLFRDHPAWGTTIIPGTTKGTHRLRAPGK